MNAVPKPFGVMPYKSNGALSVEANAVSKKAKEVTSQAKDGDPQSHRVAGDINAQAAHQLQQAGNISKAKEHQAQAAVHYEKSQAGDRAKYFADEEGRTAELLSKKAELAKHGQDPKDARTETQLHSDAADAHERASKAYDMAGQDRDSKYHAEKAEHHRSSMEDAASSDS
jgi:hypothetical protein